MPVQKPPFDSIRALIALMPEESEASRQAVRARQAVLTKPPGSLGRLEDIAGFLAAWQALRARNGGHDGGGREPEYVGAWIPPSPERTVQHSVNDLARAVWPGPAHTSPPAEFCQDVQRRVGAMFSLEVRDPNAPVLTSSQFRRARAVLTDTPPLEYTSVNGNGGGHA